MGQGRGHKAALAAMRGANGAPPTSAAIAQQLAKQLNMPVNLLRAAAYYQKLDKNSTERRLMDALNKNAGLNGRGSGSLGSIMLRMKFGPRTPLLDLYDALKPLSEHGLISSVVPLTGNPTSTQLAQIEIQSTLSRANLRKLQNVSTDVLVALLDTFRGQL